MEAGREAPMIKEKVMAATGEKPGTGTYFCRKCGQAVLLTDAADALPPCPHCQGTKFRR